MSETTTDIIRAKIYRYDPSMDEAPRYEIYEVPKPTSSVDRLSVSKLLEYIFENLDPTLGYYHTCNRAHCDACSVLINGKADLACITYVEEEDEITIDPPQGQHIRDLIVERSPVEPREPHAKERVLKMAKGTTEIWYDLEQAEQRRRS